LAELHDQVIQRLFAAGLSPQSVAVSLGEGKVTERIFSTVADLDAAISQLRTRIFELHDLPRSSPGGVRARLLDVASGAANALGFDPAVRSDGLVDTVPADVGEDLVAVLRESLANVARHAGARRAEVDLVVRSGDLSLSVQDDGVGITSPARSSGPTTMRHRAERHGGNLDIGARETGGTRVCWTVPRR
jgi:signal transduction histidine kinase